MKIDYDKIIEAANVRKDTLKALESKLQDAQSHLNMLRHGADYFIGLYHIYNSLDAEGKQLLPKDLGSCVYNLSNMGDRVKRDTLYNESQPVLDRMADLLRANGAEG